MTAAGIPIPGSHLSYTDSGGLFKGKMQWETPDGGRRLIPGNP